jgi:Concanavalin A-like lectin/glucanases superfamily
VKKNQGRSIRLVALTMAGLLPMARPAAADLSAGLVGYYQLSTSSKVNDSSGHFNNGRAVNTAWTSDRLGNPSAASSLPGAAGDYLRIDNSTDFNFGTDDFSIALWMKYPVQNTPADVFKGIFIRSGNANSPWEGPSVFADVVLGHVMFRVSSANQLESAQGGLDDDTWRHYAFVRESNVLKIYINGVLDAQSAVPTQDVSSTAHIFLGANRVDQTI